MLEQARELGIALANSSEFIRMKQAQAAIAQNEALDALLKELQEKRTHLISVLNEEDRDGTVALELINDIDRLQGQLTENPLYTELAESENAFSTLISAVDEEINACIGIEKSECGGNCGSCGGCQH
ncbi:MAG: YlbF family regulator [Clostridia bacterium]